MKKTDFIRQMEIIIPNFKVPNEQKEAFNEIFSYFSKQQMKGLFLYGNIGTGKSSIMRVYQKILAYSDYSFQIYNERQIHRLFLKNGDAGLNELQENIITNNYNVESKNPMNICIDDIGLSSSLISNFGNKADVIQDLLYDRYELMIKYRVVTHATSNSLKGFVDSLSPRIQDRMKEMFVFIELPGQSFRGRQNLVNAE